MKYLLIVAIMAGALLCSVPAYADAGVSVTLTTTVVSNGGVTPFDSDSHPYTPPNWASVFPSMNQPQSSSPSYVPPVQQPVYIPPVILEPQKNYVPPVTPIQEPTRGSDTMIYIFIGLGAILIGLILYLILPDQKVR